MITSLEDLLHPHDPASLHAAAAARQRLLLRTDRSAAFARLLPWSRFNEMVTPDRVVAGQVELFRNHTIVPAEMSIVRPRRQKPPVRMRAEALAQYARQGVSVVVNGLQTLDAAILRMNAVVEREFRAPVHTNVYASFGPASAFAPHWDDHDVLVLQLHGRKHWRCWGQPWVAPTRRPGFEVPNDPGEPAWEAVLEPGDVLFVPRGEIHAARVVDGEESLHLTVGITPPRIAALTEALARMCDAEAVGRQDLPILADAAGRRAWMDAARALLHRAVDGLDLDDVLDGLDRMREPLPVAFLGLAARPGPDTIVACALTRRLRLPPVEAGACRFAAGRQSWSIDAAERAVLDEVQRRHAGTVASLAARLPELDGEILLRAVRGLAGKGLVQLLDGEPAPPVR